MNFSPIAQETLLVLLMFPKLNRFYIVSLFLGQNKLFGQFLLCIELATFFSTHC